LNMIILLNFLDYEATDVTGSPWGELNRRASLPHVTHSCQHEICWSECAKDYSICTLGSQPSRRTCSIACRVAQDNRALHIASSLLATCERKQPVCTLARSRAWNQFPFI